MQGIEPENYKLPFLEKLELAEVFERSESSTLTDFKIYNEHPDWFVKNQETGKIDYDENLGIRMILEARRKLNANENPNNLLKETLKAITPNKNELRVAKENLQRFFEAATQLFNLRVENGSIDPTELSFYLEEVPSKLRIVESLSGIIPESCIRSCSNLTSSIVAPCPPKEPWQELVDRTSRRSIATGPSAV